MIQIDFNPSTAWTDSERKHCIDALASGLLTRLNGSAIQLDEIRDALERISLISRRSSGFLENNRAAIVQGQCETSGGQPVAESGKMSRDEACAELARRMVMPLKPRFAGGYFVPQFFTSRDAAAELLAWLADSDKWESFVEQLNSIICGYNPAKFPGVAANKGQVALLYKRALLATPEQIALAACASLGIEVE